MQNNNGQLMNLGPIIKNYTPISSKGGAKKRKNEKNKTRRFRTRKNKTRTRRRYR
jgi:hypothetical protein